MNGWMPAAGEVASFVGDHAIHVGLGAIGLTLLVALLISWRRGKVDSWLVAVTWIGVLGFSAEGMWMVATEKARVPEAVAAGIFFVAEALMVRSMRASSKRYRATTLRDADGKVVKAGDPGKHGRAVWLIAIAAGIVVAFAAHNSAEAALRFLLPLGAALLWWNDLTDEGVDRDASATSWRWTPRRLLLAVGAIEPGARDAVTVDRERRISQMTVVVHKLHHGWPQWEWIRGRRTAKLRRLALAADDVMVAEVRRRVERVHRIEDTTKPGQDEPAAEVTELTAMVRDQARTAANRVRGFQPFSLASPLPMAAVAGQTPANGRPLNGHQVAAPPATRPAAPAANAPATPPASPPANDPANRPATPRPTKRPAKAEDVAAKVAKLAAKKPDITSTQVADQLRLTERTARRYLAAYRQSNPNQRPEQGDRS